LMLVEADGDSDLFFGRNHGDGTDPFPGALNRTRVDDEGAPNLRSFSGAPTQLAIHDIAQVGAAMRLSLQVRAPGWLPTQQFAPARYDPLPSYGSASTAALADDGTDYVVRNEIRAGRPQVMLRWGGVLWDREFQVSNSTGAALDPTLAGLPGGDLAVVWSDTREGRAKLFYRARVRGVWTGERKLVELPGSCLAPAIATDRRGMVYLAFQHSESDVPRVMFMRFTYRSPFGIPRALTAPPMYPSTPAIAVSPLGVAHVVWTDHPLDPTQPPRIWFARYQPDSGLTEPLTLTRFPNYSQNGLAAVTDGNGTLHVLWGVSGPGVYELHYQRRTAAAAPLPRDTVIERQSEPFQAPTLAADPQGGLHLVYEASVSGEPQIRYRRWRPGRGWDFGSTVVSDGIDGPFAQPVAIPASNDVVTVVFSGFEGGVPRLLVRRRTLPLAPLGAPPLVAAPESPAVRVGPNPLPRGAALALIADAALPEPWLDVFDVAGRRLASVRLVRDGERWRGELTGSATRTWPAGVYFIRPRAAPGRGRSWMMLR